MNLSDLLKEARGDCSFREMQRRTGISHTYLYQLENGVDPRTLKSKLPSLDTLKTLSDTLHIDFATLLASVGFTQMFEAHEENKRLREALEFYGDRKNYGKEEVRNGLWVHNSAMGITFSNIHHDDGETARKALEGETQ